ncbi:MAG: ATP-binding cassette domain-containing protein, partial [Clostridiales bacterium]|nr:ATP-binding cassette domain-containing protein [Clostridiales bacterium]
MKAAVEMYYNGIKNNVKEEKRFARQTANYEKKIAKGKTPDWKVADKKLFDPQAAKSDIINLANRVKAHFERDIAQAEQVDFAARTSALIDFLKDKASGVAHKITRGMAKTRALKLMEEVGIPEARKRFRQYPFEFSGGMRQRIVIAIALSADPDVLICDEPTTALDVTIQSQILELINKVKRERNLSVIFITHDLGVVANMADRVAVMYAGKIVEIGTALDIFHAPAHPYTWALLSSMPDLDTKDKLEAIPGTPPNMIYPPKGDAFAERNKYAMQIDFEAQPPMFKISDTHYAATWLLHPSAPKVDPPKPVLDRIARMKAQTASAIAQSADQSSVKVADGDIAEADAPTETTETSVDKKKTSASKPAAKKTSSKPKAVKPKDAPASVKPSASKPTAAKKPATKSGAKKPTEKSVKTND